MKTKTLSLLGLLSLFVFSSCSIYPKPSESVSESISSGTSSSEDSSESTSESSESSESSEESSESSDSEESISEDIHKDEEGFIILPDDYLAYEDDPTDTKKRNKISFAPQIDGADYYTSNMRLYVAGQRIPLYNVKINGNHTFAPDAPNRGDVAVASVSIEGQITFQIHTTFKFLGVCRISPLGRNVPYQLDETYRVCSFTINTPGQYTIEFKNGTILHLFVNKMKDDGYNPSNCIYFDKGIHDKTNDSRINSNNVVELNSNQTVYLADGAIVRAKFNAYQKSNIKILGPGFIDGSKFVRNASTGEVTVPIDFNYCNNVEFDSIGIMDPAGWCYNMYFCNGVTINNTKIISSRANGDGISIQSCQNVEVTNSFVRSWDDSLVVKNYPRWSDRSQEGTTNHVHFSDCMIYNDLAQCMEIGYECVGEVMNDITFTNITVTRATHLAPISIHNSNNANLTNVKYDGITIENADMGQGNGNKYLVDFSCMYSSTWSEVQKKTALGSVDGVVVKNVKVNRGITDAIVSVRGSMETRSEYPNVAHYMNNVSFQDFEIYGQKLTSAYTHYQTQYSNNVTFSNTGEVTGATYVIEDTSMYGHNITVL